MLDRRLSLYSAYMVCTDTHHGIMCSVCGRACQAKLRYIDHSKVGFLSQIRAICLADDQETPCSMRDGTWPVGEMQWPQVLFGWRGSPQSKQPAGCILVVLSSR